MGRKNKNTSFDKRQLVIYHRQNGYTYEKIGHMLKMSKSTVGDIVGRFKNEDRIDFIPQTGRPKAFK